MDGALGSLSLWGYPAHGRGGAGGPLWSLPTQSFHGSVVFKTPSNPSIPWLYGCGTTCDSILRRFLTCWHFGCSWGPSAAHPAVTAHYSVYKRRKSMLQLCQLGTVWIHYMLKWKLVKKRVETELLFSLLGKKKNYEIICLLILICI